MTSAAARITGAPADGSVETVVMGRGRVGGETCKTRAAKC